MSDVRVRMLEIFREFDTNSDGLISQEELHNVLQRLGLDRAAIAGLFAALQKGKSGGIDYETFVEWLHASPDADPTRVSHGDDEENAQLTTIDKDAVHVLLKTSKPLAHIRDTHSFPVPRHESVDWIDNHFLWWWGGHPDEKKVGMRNVVRMALVHREDGIPKTSLRKERTASRDRKVMTGQTVKEEERLAVLKTVEEYEDSGLISWSLVRTIEGHQGWMQSSHLLFETWDICWGSFHDFDIDQDGVISLDDMRSWTRSNKCVAGGLKFDKMMLSAEDLMSEMDYNKDGKVSRWEFSNFAAEHGHFRAMLAGSAEGQIFEESDTVMVWHTYVGNKQSTFEGQESYIPQSRVPGVPGIWVGPGRVTSVDPLKVMLAGAKEAQWFDEVRFADKRCYGDGPGALKPYNPDLVMSSMPEDEYGYYYRRELTNPPGYYDNHCGKCGVPDVIFSSGGTCPDMLECQKCKNVWWDFSQSSCCFHGDCMIEMESGFLPAKDVKAGCNVRTPDGAANVLCVVRSACPQGLLEMAELDNGLLVTPSHPVQDSGGSWQRASSIGMLSLVSCNHVYNFVLSHAHILYANGSKCITLGHDFKDPGLGHWYFGTERVLEDLRLQPGWLHGYVELGGSDMTPCNCAERGRKSGQEQQIACMQRVLQSEPTCFTPELLLMLHASAMEETGIPLGFRERQVQIDGAKHRPPDAIAVPGLIKLFCARMNAHIFDGNLDLWTLGAFCLWWVNSVHPFQDGNGRVARALCIIAMSASAKNSAAWDGLTAWSLHEPFESSSRQKYLRGLQDANEICGFCSCCRTRSRTFSFGGLSCLAKLLKDIFQ